MSQLSEAVVVALSKWVDDHNKDRDPEALLWHRVSKVAEESGEVMTELLGMSGQNPRKGYYSNRDAVAKELLDTATAALGAVEHLYGNDGSSFRRLDEHIVKVGIRAGVVK